MGQLRLEKVREFIKQEVSKIILQELKDPRIGFVTVTDVEASSDLRYAKIFVSLLGTEAEQEATWAGLQRALGHIQSEIGRRIRLRFTPELSLHRDESLQYSAKINDLIRQVKRKEENNGHQS